MKKIILLIITVASFSCLFAQTPEKEVTAEKDYSVYFPKAGDISLGLDLGNTVSFLGSTIFGNLLNRVEDVAQMSIGQELNAVKAYQSNIFGKYFLTDTRALRGRLGVSFDNSTTRKFVHDDFKGIYDPFSEDLTVDKRIQRQYAFELGIGMEFRRSLWRLQGYVGGEVFGGYSNKKLSYEYGNDITSTNQLPSTSVFGDNENISQISDNRILRYKDINTISYGAGVFVGVDYFINRNISLGVEFKFDGRMSHSSEETAVSEGWRNDRIYTKEEQITPRGTAFSLVPTTYLSLMFYF